MTYFRSIAKSSKYEKYISLYASEALYKQDYQAYKEIYFSYLDNLAKERKYVIYRR